MDDPLQKECFLFVFVPEVETAVSEYVQVWNLHLVRQINENGCFRGSHVPQRYFREFERINGWRDHLLEDPHETMDDDDIGVQDLGPRGNGHWRHEEDGHQDLQQLPRRLPPRLKNLRIEAYGAWLARLGAPVNAIDRFVFYYNLSLYCHEAMLRQVYFTVLRVAENSELSELALNILVELQNRDR
jgi:hypothetical protein